MNQNSIDTIKKSMNDYENAKITGDQAAKILGISRATFMRRIRERKNP